MGQRLNIEIHENGKCLANAYYHWSAFTEDAIKLTQKIIDYFPSRQNKNGWTCAYELLYHTGARFVPDELMRIGIDENIARMLGMGANRDNGLIAISEEGIEETRFWEEGRVTIDIGREIVDFEVFLNYTDEYEDENEISPEYVESDYDNHNIPFCLFDNFSLLLLNVNKRVFKFNNDDGVLTAIY